MFTVYLPQYKYHEAGDLVCLVTTVSSQHQEKWHKLGTQYVFIKRQEGAERTLRYVNVCRQGTQSQHSTEGQPTGVKEND